MLTLSLVFLSWQCQPLHASPENGTQTEQTSDSSSDGGAVEDAIKPFYTMTNTFLDIVHPTSREWILDNAVVSSFLNGTLTNIGKYLCTWCKKWHDFNIFYSSTDNLKGAVNIRVYNDARVIKEIGTRSSHFLVNII